MGGWDGVFLETLLGSLRLKIWALSINKTVLFAVMLNLGALPLMRLLKEFREQISRFIHLIHVSVLPACIYVPHICLVRDKTRSGCWIFWYWSYRCLWVTRVPGTEPRSSAKRRGSKLLELLNHLSSLSMSKLLPSFYLWALIQLTLQPTAWKVTKNSDTEIQRRVKRRVVRFSTVLLTLQCWLSFLDASADDLIKQAVKLRKWRPRREKVRHKLLCLRDNLPSPE